MAGIPPDHYEPKTGPERWLNRRLPIIGLLLMRVRFTATEFDST